MKKEEISTTVLVLGLLAAFLQPDGLRVAIVALIALFAGGCVHLSDMEEDAPNCRETTVVGDFLVEGDTIEAVINYYGDETRRGYTIAEAKAVNRQKSKYSMTVCARPDAVVRFEIRRADTGAPACGQTDSVLFVLWEQEKNKHAPLPVKVQVLRDQNGGPYCEVLPIYSYHSQ